ncbi:hypothetical protein A8U91_01343 [Halomonas elongata]|uniref:Uncharacterized protein n=1 Tax=Halomonas elongata TaxID=2746 RepID=A0A1B8P3Z1_HALEL|nr:hypothetical protein A8U91_01343 [Halomonas elongata]
MKKAVLMGSLALGLFPGVHASEECAKISDNQSRLACYDAEYRPATTSDNTSDWYVREETSPIDDSRTVVLSTMSIDSIKDRLGRQDKAMMAIRCIENTTSIIFQFANHHMADLNQYGVVTLRIDDQDAFKRRMSESTDNKALGLWNGGSSIPVVKRLFDADTLTVRATPYGQSPITVQFPVGELKKAIEPLREACHW